MARPSIGFSEQDNSSDGMEAIRKLFAPEFRNRLDAIVQFSSLSGDVVKTIVDKFLTELQAQLDDKRVTLEVDDEARGVAGPGRLRREDGRPAHAAPHPGTRSSASWRT